MQNNRCLFHCFDTLPDTSSCHKLSWMQYTGLPPALSRQGLGIFICTSSSCSERDMLHLQREETWRKIGTSKTKLSSLQSVLQLNKASKKICYRNCNDRGTIDRKYLVLRQMWEDNIARKTRNIITTSCTCQQSPHSFPSTNIHLSGITNCPSLVIAISLT